MPQVEELTENTPQAREADRQHPVLKYLYFVLDPFQRWLDRLERAYGRAIGCARASARGENMVANHLVMLDFDTGITVEHVQAEIERHGLFAVIYYHLGI